MKRKLLAILLSLVAAMALAGYAITVGAEDDASDLPELSVVDVNFSPPWNGFLINFGIQSGKVTENISTPENLLVQDSVKKDITASYGYMVHESYLF